MPIARDGHRHLRGFARVRRRAPQSVRSYIAARWQDAVSGFWLLPGLFVVAAAVLAFGLLALDRAFAPGTSTLLFGGGASAARTVMSTIAGAMATIMGVVFSITIVALQLVSSQHSPLALRNMLKDRVVQTAAGVFAGVFVYGVLVLRAVRSAGESGGFVPRLSVTVGIVLGISGLAYLLVFIHHMATGIQGGAIVERIGLSGLASLETPYPSRFGEPAEGDVSWTLPAAWTAGREPHVVRAARPGFVEQVALGALARTLPSAPRCARLFVRPGDFVTPGQRLAHVWCDGDTRRAELAVLGAVDVTAQRDGTQDPGFAIRQLVDIALRALSPAVNDPTTARTCIRYLEALVVRLAATEPIVPARLFSNPPALLVAPPASFETQIEPIAELADAASGRVSAALADALLAGARSARASGHEERETALLALVPSHPASAAASSRQASSPT